MKQLLSRIRQKGDETIEALFALAIIGGCFAAWCTHIYVCFNGNRWGFLIAGALFFPIAIVHGIGIWFGFW